MTAFELIPLIAATVNLALAVFVCTQDLRLRANQVFLVCVAMLAVWNFGASSLFQVANPHIALWCARLTMFGVIWIPVAFFHVTVLITHSRADRRILWCGYLVTSAIAVSVLTPLFVRGVRRLDYGAWFAIAGPVFYVFAGLVFPALVIPTFYLLFRRLKTASAIERRKLRPLIVADALLCIFGTHDLGPVYGFDRYPGTHIPIYPWGTLAASVYGLIIGNALLQDQLLDMRVSLGRHAATFVRFLFLIGTTYILLALCALAVPGSFLFSSFVASLSAVTIASLITAYFFPRFLGAKSERLEQRILGDRFEYQDQVRRFAESIPAYTSIDKLLADTRDVFIRTVRLASFELFVLDPHTHELNHAVAAPKESLPTLQPDSPLIDFFVSDSRKDYLDCRNEEPSLWDFNAVRAARNALAPRNPDIVYAIRTGNLSVIGLLLCGSKDSGAPITAHDLELILSLCRQLGYAFERMHLAQQAAMSERLETLTWMSRGLAHDLPNAVMPISTFLELQGETIAAADERYPLLQLAKRNTANILAYAQEAMFFAHDFQLRYAPIDPDQLLENVLVATASRAERHSVKVVTKVSAQVSFEGDPMLLQRLLGNLVSNACDASAAGKTIVVNCFSLPDTRSRTGWVRFEVIDEGSGIPAEQISHIFEPYYSTKQVGDVTRGFGLGLTIAQKIVLLHQGTITVKSEVNRGTTFTVDLPPRNPGAPLPAS